MSLQGCPELSAVMMSCMSFSLIYESKSCGTRMAGASLRDRWMRHQTYVMLHTVTGVEVIEHPITPAMNANSYM